MTLQNIGYDPRQLAKVKLPFLASNDVFVEYRSFTVRGYDDSPGQVFTGYTLGAFDDSFSGSVGLVNTRAKNSGMLYVSGPNAAAPLEAISVSLYGKSPVWTTCTKK